MKFKLLLAIVLTGRMFAGGDNMPDSDNAHLSTSGKVALPALEPEREQKDTNAERHAQDLLRSLLQEHTPPKAQYQNYHPNKENRKHGKHTTCR